MDDGWFGALAIGFVSAIFAYGFGYRAGKRSPYNALCYCAEMARRQEESLRADGRESVRQASSWRFHKFRLMEKETPMQNALWQCQVCHLQQVTPNSMEFPDCPSVECSS